MVNQKRLPPHKRKPMSRNHKSKHYMKEDNPAKFISIAIVVIAFCIFIVMF